MTGHSKTHLSAPVHVSFYLQRRVEYSYKHELFITMLS